MSCTITNLICTLLFLVSFLACYWADGLHTATYLLNYLPSKAFSHLTPFTLFGTAPSCSYLRVFRCTYYPNTSATTPHKLAPRSTRRFFLGYSSDHKRCQCLDLVTHHIIISCQVLFDEDVFPLGGSSTPLDLDSLLNVDPVDAPPPLLSVSATSSAPCASLSPSTAPRAALPLRPPSDHFADPVRVYQRHVCPLGPLHCRVAGVPPRRHPPRPSPCPPDGHAAVHGCSLSRRPTGAHDRHRYTFLICPILGS